MRCEVEGSACVSNPAGVLVRSAVLSKQKARKVELMSRSEWQDKASDDISQFLNDPLARHGSLKDPFLAQRANVFLTQVRLAMSLSAAWRGRSGLTDGVANRTMPRHHIPMRISDPARSSTPLRPTHATFHHA